jgi:ABC-type multidrug transport system ATPase subunit
LRGKLTLILGPPGSGKSLLLKALCGRVRTSGKCTFEGIVTYNGETESTGKFLLPKFLDYIEQKDSHASTLTVAETMEFAWRSTTGGHHSYGIKKNEEAGNLLDEGDEILRKVSFPNQSRPFIL